MLLRHASRHRRASMYQMHCKVQAENHEQESQECNSRIFFIKNEHLTNIKKQHFGHVIPQYSLPRNGHTKLSARQKRLPDCSQPEHHSWATMPNRPARSSYPCRTAHSSDARRAPSYSCTILPYSVRRNSYGTAGKSANPCRPSS